MTPNTTPGRYLTEKEAAARFQLNPKTLRRWRADGTGPNFLRLGAAVRYHESHLDEWALSKAVS
ncbi:helix-turn-helix domain-containing protein [Microcella daejeonensis]|uniref:helix-turn-helix transcriptional regulator n=1 Tax=Microcella daejeonensis TaxID=2994971 RepID=UPI002271749F|nr:helix-turn-helix domain-containing protein [Microcella daejeonensis]WAB84966.1 helix-turn-helix domain-containing protein [Microcella daejeonensis]